MSSLVPILGMFTGRTSTPRASTMSGRQPHVIANNEELTAHLQIAAGISRECQERYSELQGLLQHLDANLQGAHALSVQNIIPDQQSGEVLRARDAEIAALHKELEESARERDRLTATLAERDRALRHVLQDRDGMSKLLDNRTTELDAAQAFLPAANSVTDTHVIGLVQALNYEIVQAATALTDSFEGEVRQLPISDALSAELASSVRRVGNPVASLLSSSGEDQDLSLQIGLQAFLIRISKMQLYRWHFRGRTSLNATLTMILDAIKGEEPEHVAVRWSALTHKYARVAIDRELAAQDVAGLLARQWADAVTLAGYCHDVDAAETSALVLNRVGLQLLEVSKLIMELNAVLGQMVLRGWMYCIGGHPGEVFDPTTMELDYQDTAEGEASRDFRVVGTTALGLERSQGDEDVILLKPKVAVERAKSTKA